MFLFESWLSKDSDIDLSGYISFNFYRKFQNRRARRNSGGTILYIKDYLRPGIEVIRSHYDTIIWLKLDKHFFHTESDIYICGVYIWCEDSPVYNVVNVDLFDILQNDINDFADLGSVYIAGDWNSRVGDKHDFILNDTHSMELDDTEYNPDVYMPRCTSDKVCNSYGFKLLDLCKSTGFRIANGRLYNDLQGKFTFINSRGASVIDMLLCRERDFSMLNYLEISDFNEYSDHASILFTIKCNIVKERKNVIKGTKVLWNGDFKQQFRSGIIGKLTELNNLVNNIDINNRDSINTVLNNFTSVIRNVADPLFMKTYDYKEKNTFNDKPIIENKDWFDLECERARKQYINDLKCFHYLNSTENRQKFCTSKKFYKDLCKRKRKTYERIKHAEIEKLKNSSPKDFWKYFKKTTKTSNNISLEDFKNYFANLGSTDFQNANVDAEIFCQNHNFEECENQNVEELDMNISLDEVIKAAKSLKRNKAVGSDFIMNEYLIDSIDIIGSHLCDIFNAILNSGFFPEKWMEGVIVPLHKKGDKNDVNNYRGITLVSCLSKLFTTILNDRITTFCDKNNVISDAQFGFRKGRSTIDALYILSSIVQNYIFQKKRLYCVFIDLSKCFDTIYRNALWMKLFKSGIQGKILRIIKDMYQKVKSCVRSCNTYSDYFEYAVGLRQGEIMSPMLFSLFVEDLELFLEDGIDSGINIDDIVLILLLFADDMVILAKSPNELQNSLNLLYQYCQNWGLRVNTEKSKIMVFRKRGRLLENERWTYNGNELEVVDNFTYLGTIINYTGNYNLNEQYVSGKGLKALNVLLNHCKKLKLSPKTLCELFDAFVGSILCYSSELWGFKKYQQIENLHIKFCKRILNVRTSTSNAGVYGELGRYPIYILHFVKIIKYWFKLINTDNIILQKVYTLAVEDCNKGAKNWVYNLKNLLFTNGYGYVWENPQSISPRYFAIIFKKTLTDCFVQEWKAKINASNVLLLYKNCKVNFVYENYLNVIPACLRSHITRLRISGHSLRIHTGRYARTRVPQDERYCQCCQTRDLEDEYHFILKCPCFSELRREYIKRYYTVRPNMLKFIELMRSDNKSILRNLSMYCKRALEHRNTILNNILNR